MNVNRTILKFASLASNSPRSSENVLKRKAKSIIPGIAIFQNLEYGFLTAVKVSANP